MANIPDQNACIPKAAGRPIVVLWDLHFGVGCLLSTLFVAICIVVLRARCGPVGFLLASGQAHCTVKWLFRSESRILHESFTTLTFSHESFANLSRLSLSLTILSQSLTISQTLTDR